MHLQATQILGVLNADFNIKSHKVLKAWGFIFVISLFQCSLTPAGAAMLLFAARPSVLCKSSLLDLQALPSPSFFPGQPSQSQKEKVLRAAKESLIFEYFTSISTS